MLLPHLGFLTAAYQRKNRTGNNGNISTADDLEKPKRVSHLFVTPLIASHDRDAKNFYLWGLDHHQKSLQVAATWSGAVLVDDHLTARLGNNDAGDTNRESDKDCRLTSHIGNLLYLNNTLSKLGLSSEVHFRGGLVMRSTYIL